MYYSFVESSSRSRKMNSHPLFLKYWAYQLTLNSCDKNISGLVTALYDAKIDMLPYQLEATSHALKALRDHDGVILADEVGLGKTIETGIVISERWLHSKRKILIITPASLIEQWCRELSDKFQLPAETIDGKAFRCKNPGNPFFSNNIIICSYHFARNKAKYIAEIPWDLVVIDEAHNLCNQQGIISSTIRKTLNNIPKILVTATPLQNSASELYSLASMINEYLFGSKEFLERRLLKPKTTEDFNEVKRRLAPIMVRTLRKDSDKKFVNRISVTKNFRLTPSEKRLYGAMEKFICRDNLHCLAGSQRALVKMTLRRLLASSALNLAETLKRLKQRLNDTLTVQGELPKPVKSMSKEQLDDLERLQTFKIRLSRKFSTQELDEIRNEVTELETLYHLAVSAKDSNRTEALLYALEEGLEMVEKNGGNRKAVIFTEFLQTQQHLDRLIQSKSEFKTVKINGANLNPQSEKIYRDWLKIYRNTPRYHNSPNIDRKTALIDYFKDHGEILIATEAAAEGLNLQFCSLVINYDLPWNPQRIEQRIGRCHRYGQESDVVVVNFMNLDNQAEQRLLELLKDKLKLFDGIFSLSNKIVESPVDGKDFERWVRQVFTQCRNRDEIKAEFDKQEAELDKLKTKHHETAPEHLGDKLWDGIKDTFKGHPEELRLEIERQRNKLWQIIKRVYGEYGKFSDESMTFRITSYFARNFKRLPEGNYALNPHTRRKGFEHLTLGHSVVKDALLECKGNILDGIENIQLRFNLSRAKDSSLKGKKGWLRVTILRCKCHFEYETLVYSGCFISDGQVSMMPEDTVKMLLEHPCRITTVKSKKTDGLDTIGKSDRERIRKESNSVAQQYEAHIASIQERLTTGKEERLESMRTKLKSLQQVLTDIEETGDVRAIKLAQMRFDLAWKQYCNDSAELESNVEHTIAQSKRKFSPRVIPEVIFTVRWKAL
jgi:ERCC4-related helicase